MSIRSAGAVKRGAYFAIIPLGIVAALAGLAISEWSGEATPFHRTILIGMSAWLGVLLIWHAVLRPAWTLFEPLLLYSLGVFFLLRLGYAFYFRPETKSLTHELAEFAWWFPALYGLAFMIRGVARGVALAGVYFAATVLLGVPFLLGWTGAQVDMQELYTVSQMYLSSGVAIVVIAFLGRTLLRFAREATVLDEMAHTDPLTGVSNRRDLMNELTQELKRAARYGSDVSVLLLDIDHFKRVNDEHGHAVGDDVLREFAALLRDQSRDVDLVGRWGGEEFLVILPEVGPADASRAAERIRERVERTTFGPGLDLTTSIGASGFCTGDTVDDVLKRADDALYAAKRAGRNRVALDMPSGDPQPSS